jgi:hypothetical protein
MGGLLTMYALRSILDFLSILNGLIHYRRVILFQNWILNKKERLIPQTPSIRRRNHSYLGNKLRMEDLTAK